MRTEFAMPHYESQTSSLDAMVDIPSVFCIGRLFSPKRLIFDLKRQYRTFLFCRFSLFATYIRIAAII